jgi:uncharacterized protein YkwD
MRSVRDYNVRMKTPIPLTLTSRMMLSGLLFVLISPWSLKAAPASTESLGVQARFQTSGGSRYFPQTGKTVSGDFLRAFDRYGVALAGWPISNEVIEGGLKVQYFERVRMEHHPELAAKGYTVLLTRLGAEMVPAGNLARIRAFTSSTSKVYYPQTGHSLSAPFLKFWRDRGGVETFGYPISEPVWEGGLKVQWFERARMEHHPQLESRGWGVQLTRLGDQAWARSGRPGAAPPPAQPSAGLSGAEKYLLDMINAERGKAGMGQVESLPELSALARSRSEDMAARNYFSHTTPEGTDVFAQLRTRNIAFALAGEIIARSTAQDYGQATEMAQQAFLNSPSHRAIMLDAKYSYVGVGHGRASDGASYFTVVFVQR